MVKDDSLREIADAIRLVFISPNPISPRLEPTTLVDAVSEVAIALHRIADAFGNDGIATVEVEVR